MVQQMPQQMAGDSAAVPGSVARIKSKVKSLQVEPSRAMSDPLPLCAMSPLRTPPLSALPFPRNRPLRPPLLPFLATPGTLGSGLAYPTTVELSVGGQAGAGSSGLRVKRGQLVPGVVPGIV